MAIQKLNSDKTLLMKMRTAAKQRKDGTLGIVGAETIETVKKNLKLRSPPSSAGESKKSNGLGDFKLIL